MAGFISKIFNSSYSQSEACVRRLSRYLPNWKGLIFYAYINRFSSLMDRQHLVDCTAVHQERQSLRLNVTAANVNLPDTLNKIGIIANRDSIKLRSPGYHITCTSLFPTT